MQIEWIVGGAVLLVAALAVKMTMEQLMLQRLGLTFTFVWAFLVACHFWQAIALRFSGLGTLLRGVPMEVISFWLAFLFSALPGILLMRLWLKEYDAPFPLMIERLSAVLCTLVVGVGFPSLIVMTVTLMPPRLSRALPSEGLWGAVASGLGRGPVTLYLQVADSLSGRTAEALEEEHLPDRVRHVLLDRPRERRRSGA